MGLINQIVPKSQLLPTAEALAKKIASYDPYAVRKAKEAVVRGMDLPLPEGLSLERRLAQEVALRRKAFSE
jgi:enoyl-CoA hydratase/carnithine racemase